MALFFSETSKMIKFKAIDLVKIVFDFDKVQLDVLFKEKKSVNLAIGALYSGSELNGVKNFLKSQKNSIIKMASEESKKQLQTKMGVFHDRQDHKEQGFSCRKPFGSLVIFFSERLGVKVFLLRSSH